MTAAGQPGTSSTPGDGVENLVIIGSGPAGYTAAIYAARANLSPLLITPTRAEASADSLAFQTEVRDSYELQNKRMVRSS